MNVPRPKLLVSVRDAREAAAAMLGEADIIDVKEPRNGSLGAAESREIGAVLAQVAGWKPISAALGELRDAARHLASLPAGLTYVKAGLAGERSSPDWRERWSRLAKATPSACELIPVAYADAEAANAPALDEVVALAVAQRSTCLLIDTFQKDGRGLFDFAPIERLRVIADRLREARAGLALAGSLRLEDLGTARSLAPAIIAVRGAACGGDRDADIDPGRVRTIQSALDGAGIVVAASGAP